MTERRLTSSGSLVLSTACRATYRPSCGSLLFSGDLTLLFPKSLLPSSRSHCCENSKTPTPSSVKSTAQRGAAPPGRAAVGFLCGRGALARQSEAGSASSLRVCPAAHSTTKLTVLFHLVTANRVCDSETANWPTGRQV